MASTQNGLTPESLLELDRSRGLWTPESQWEPFLRGNDTSRRNLLMGYAYDLLIHLDGDLHNEGIEASEGGA